MIRKQVDFPFLEEYKKHFDITENTIFACLPDIYTNNDLTEDLLVHEMVHLRQQANHEKGLTGWVYDFLYDPKFRLEQELEAYREQLKSIKDRNHRARVRFASVRQLSSSLYGNIISLEDAQRLLK